HGHHQTPRKPLGEIHLKVSTVRESRSDDRRFSIFSGTKRLHLRAETREDRAAWLEALRATKEMFPRMSTSEMVGPGDTAAAAAVSTERLKKRLQQEGVSDAAIADSERIVREEFEALHKQLVLLKQKQALLLDTLRHLECDWTCLFAYFYHEMNHIYASYISMLNTQGDSVMRILSVAAFVVSSYASTDGRSCKPFNPLLGETYEADYPDKGLRFFSEKVSHHPMVVACHCEGNGWRFWADSNLKSKFWGRSIQLDPVGVLTLQFDDGEVFQWSKVTTSIYNLILGKLYCDHYGNMRIQGNREYSCKLKFKEQSIIDRNPHQVFNKLPVY
ncbi:oxysterol-binding protein-related protein 1C-like, partial [Triticum dicoccoides]|uniref:oxysterol-binding protein-related protein 1C-like n=1 Tax=Triticum dicoccoides TaxID=85692 RepID=UPI00188FE254